MYEADYKILVPGRTSFACHLSALKSGNDDFGVEIINLCVLVSYTRDDYGRQMEIN